MPSTKITKTTKGKSSSSKPNEIGEVYLLKTSKGVFHPSQLKIEKNQEKKESKQVSDEDTKFLTEKDLKPHPFNVKGLLWLMDNCEYFDACVKQIGTDVVGQGYELKLVEGKKENKKDKEKIEKFLNEPNSNEEESFEKIVKNAVVDLESIGWFGLELARDKTQPLGIWNVPAHTLWIHKDKEIFCQERGTKKVWFKKFGSEKDIDSKSGKEKKGTSDPANELIYYKEYYQQSNYYGRPPILPSVGAARGLVGIRDYNLAFFENYGIPMGWIILKGKWKKGSEKKLNDFWNTNIKGTENAHKVVILRVPREGDIIWVPIESKEAKQGSFVELDKQLREESIGSLQDASLQDRDS